MTHIYKNHKSLFKLMGIPVFMNTIAHMTNDQSTPSYTILILLIKS